MNEGDQSMIVDVFELVLSVGCVCVVAGLFTSKGYFLCVPGLTKYTRINAYVALPEQAHLRGALRRHSGGLLHLDGDLGKRQEAAVPYQHRQRPT